ncbi:hypothetical protein G3R49_15035 [Shewanella sp. WXL01]|uniref:hypothetical protein n=1 Tax=Shewanella sp. WXL01 TaxID=2709721 RepID=UPI001438648D|nr:hypothetical protein [Shewanella sp. WXL01]NKF51877.1 hypothetical protein [Shewanella sp. WXL01]
MSIKLSPIAIVMCVAFATNVAANEQQNGIDVSGTLRVNYAYIDYDQASRDKLGDFTFDMAAVKFDGKLDNWGLASEYRFYDGWQTLRYGYGFVDVNSNWQLQLGVTQTPFGNPGFISNSFWFGVPYYLGFEDDYDLGIKGVYNNGAWGTQIAFFKNGEASATSNERYSPDLYSGIVGDIEYHNEETNQVNLRQTYELTYEAGKALIGGSLEVGQIYNSLTGNTGSRYAAAVHMDASYQDWALQLQVMQYHYDAADAVDDNKIAVAAYQWQYEIASKAQAYSINLARTVNFDWGNIKFYNDFGLVTPDVADDSYDNSYQNVTGAAVTAGPTYTMVDFILGKNMYASTRDNGHVGLPENSTSWDKRVNINFGYYF